MWEFWRHFIQMCFFFDHIELQFCRPSAGAGLELLSFKVPVIISVNENFQNFSQWEKKLANPNKKAKGFRRGRTENKGVNLLLNGRNNKRQSPPSSHSFKLSLFPIILDKPIKPHITTFYYQNSTSCWWIYHLPPVAFHRIFHLKGAGNAGQRIRI